MNLLRAATLTVRDPEATAKRYTEWLDYAVVERGVVDADLAASWGAPAALGRAFVVLRPASDLNVFLRFVAGEPGPDYKPLRTYGWAAIEICVQDTLAVAERMAASPFEIIGPPRELDGMSVIFPMQVRGPDDEIVYLTQIRGQLPGSLLPVAQSFIDRLFILVLACSDLSAARQWFAKRLGLKVGDEIALRYTMINKAFGLPIEDKHHIATAGHDIDTFLEFDQYPEATTPRAREAGGLPPGVALVTLDHPDIDSLDVDWMTPPAARAGAVYGGRRAGTISGPDGTLIELVGLD